jgi:hypothetical protein
VISVSLRVWVRVRVRVKVSFNTFWISWIPQGFRIHGIQPGLGSKHAAIENEKQRSILIILDDR